MRAIAVAVFALLLALGGTGVALAHTELASTTPAAGSALTTSPEVIELRFTGGVTATPDSVRLFDPSSDEVPLGRVERLDGRTLRAPVERELVDGAYTVAWRAVSTDAHPLSGTFSFTVGAGGAVPSTAVPVEAGAPSPPRSADDLASGSRGVGLLFGLVRFLAFASLIVLIGTGVVVWALAREALATLATQRLLIGSAIVLALTTAASIGLQAAYAGGVGLSGAVDPDLIRAMLDTSFGKAMLPRLGVALAAIFAVRLLPGLPVLSATLAAALLLFTSLAGHASTGPLPGLAVAVDALHLGAASIWLGGIVALLAVVLRAGDELGVALRRFSRIATIAVVVIAVTGVLRTWRETAGFESLWGADYGRLAIAKAALLVGILILASRARRLVRREPPEGNAIPGSAVSRIVAVEAAIGLLVIALTAVLVIAAPPRVSSGSSIDRAAGRAFAGSVHTPSTQVDVRLEPASTGDNTLEVRIGRHTGAVFDVPAVSAKLTSDEGDEVGVGLVRVGPGRWEGDVTIPSRGRWELEVAVRTTGTDLDRARFTIIVI